MTTSSCGFSGVNERVENRRSGFSLPVACDEAKVASDALLKLAGGEVLLGRSGIGLARFKLLDCQNHRVSNRLAQYLGKALRGDTAQDSHVDRVELFDL